jgi:hypothetical protein
LSGLSYITGGSDRWVLRNGEMMISRVKLTKLKILQYHSACHECHMKSTGIDSDTPGCEAMSYMQLHGVVKCSDLSSVLIGLPEAMAH